MISYIQILQNLYQTRSIAFCSIEYVPIVDGHGQTYHKRKEVCYMSWQSRIDSQNEAKIAQWYSDLGEVVL